MRLTVIYLLLLTASAVRAFCGDADSDAAPGIGPDDLTIAEYVERWWPAAIRSLANNTRVNQTYGVLDAYEDVRRRKQWEELRCDLTISEKEDLIGLILDEYEERANKTAAMVHLFEPLYDVLDDQCILVQDNVENDFIHTKSLYALLYLIPDNEINYDPQKHACFRLNMRILFYAFLIVIGIIVGTLIIAVLIYFCKCLIEDCITNWRHQRARVATSRCASESQASDPEEASEESFHEAACVVCLESFAAGQPVVQYGCGHACVCVSCAVEIGKTACPLCRNPVASVKCMKYESNDSSDVVSDSESHTSY